MPLSAHQNGYVVAFRTDIGYAHTENQDAGLAWAAVREHGLPVGLLVVADGVSAGEHSEEASRVTSEDLRAEVLPVLSSAATTESVQTALLRAARMANARIATRPYATISRADATTLVTMACVGSTCNGLWCGDSRAYLVRDGVTTQLSHDHSWAWEVVNSGLMTAEAAERDHRAHMITRWLGPPNREDPGFDTFDLEIRSGDVVFCCSDGLYRYFADASDEMGQVITGFAHDVQRSADSLVETALARGGQDNVTIAILHAS